MLDGLLLEAAGIPAAVICTEPFAPTGRAMAAAHGVAGYDFALSGHPISTRSRPELRRLAEGVADHVVRLLLGGGEGAAGR